MQWVLNEGLMVCRSISARLPPRMQALLLTTVAFNFPQDKQGVLSAVHANILLANESKVICTIVTGNGIQWISPGMMKASLLVFLLPPP